MPWVIETAAEDALSFCDFTAALDEADFDPRDEESFAALAPLLARLGNNRTFLSDHILRELENRCGEQERSNDYSFQVILLHRARNYFIRANFWPSDSDSLVRLSGKAPFFYGVPHDHNFSFLTLGYFGPGYWSDYYEYDYDTVSGYPGEPVDLRFIERARLEEGKVMLYRAHRDVHRQLPADSFSVSINIMEVGEQAGWLDQYRFDIERGEITETLTTMPGEMLLRLAARFGGEEGRGLVEDFARNHPSDRLRFGAITARAENTDDADARRAIIEAGCADPSARIRALCAAQLREADFAPGRLKSARFWGECR